MSSDTTALAFPGQDALVPGTGTTSLGRIGWRSGQPMPDRLYEAAVKRQQRQIVEDDLEPISKSYAITQLRKSEEWLAKQQGHKSRTQDDMIIAQKIVLGCFDLLALSGASLRTWMQRRDRGRMLKQIKQKFKTKAGHRALRDMIRFTLSSIEAAPWLNDEQIVTAHLPRWTKPRVVTVEQRARIASANRRRAQKERNEIEALKQARENAMNAGTVCHPCSQQVDSQTPCFPDSNP